ncbi:alkaline phosphatase D family protein [Nakamurella aerolata]|uniref:Alkaline phosphatase family protein n=1 Tax=Nakamurella aerolata TaxID=1656892 RepID=A0A849A6H2_9ACTN|nr:alkaline phosphatase D family protein [Nakamurella aerolata]NNG36115.1 alkaline phosphatase family protein [Nakamurella aerolata]
MSTDRSDTAPAAEAQLVLGPLLRYIGTNEATVWVETSAPSTVTVVQDVGEKSWRANTFEVSGHHYAVVIVDGLEPGGSYPYRVELDQTQVWPESDSRFPVPAIRTIDPDRPTRMLFGSCRTTVPHDAEGNRTNGVDALRTLALALARGDEPWPDLVAFLGDQVYADETSDAMREFIAGRRSLDEPPGEEIKDYTEYCHLYQLAWSDPANRWLLSTVPSCMIFDDHDIRDDWNTSYSWHVEINKTQWWHQRLMGGLASYWVYQHLGNLSPQALSADPVFGPVLAAGAGAHLDLTDAVFELMERVDRNPDVYRWSYRRDLGDSRLVMVDSRAARVLEPQRRSMLSPGELDWLGDQLTLDREQQPGLRHMLIGTSLPFLLPPGMHDLEAIDETVASGGYGKVLAALGEKLRRSLDMEHWAAFNSGFDEVADMVMALARGERGPVPDTVTFLSGDVHNSYVAQVIDAAQYGAKAPIVQAVCSPIRNPMPRVVRVLMSQFARGLVRPMRFIAGHAKKVPDPQYPWAVTSGPWFDNCLAELSVHGPDLRMVWRGGVVRGDDPADPSLVQVGAAVVAGGASGAGPAETTS